MQMCPGHTTVTITTVLIACWKLIVSHLDMHAWFVARRLPDLVAWRPTAAATQGRNHSNAPIQTAIKLSASLAISSVIERSVTGYWKFENAPENMECQRGWPLCQHTHIVAMR